ncbi:hypothetical protein PoB_002167200 [Plakobranchus ocellatus]|uniref:Uncharacterized protein n=1 Tax=Plakobranchus ocellatus TaxID=259542 RepID=A0AAV3ZKV5_9GAST|nr:hypothetical protein PoB_002167200 [Plakobranchus ocellatus]
MIANVCFSRAEEEEKEEEEKKEKEKEEEEKEEEEKKEEEEEEEEGEEDRTMQMEAKLHTIVSFPFELEKNREWQEEIFFSQIF